MVKMLSSSTPTNMMSVAKTMNKKFLARSVNKEIENG